MAVDRLLPTDEAHELVELARQISDKVLDPIVDQHEKNETYPEGVFATLGEAGLLSLPYPEDWGGGGQPYEVYLQVLEELAARWAAVAVAVSVHSLSCHPCSPSAPTNSSTAGFPRCSAGDDRRLQPVRTAGRIRRRRADVQATAADDGYRITGSKAWITHGGIADFYNLFARTGEGSQGISCFLVPKDTPGLTFGKPEEKMGLHAVPTTTAHYDDAFLDADRRIGTEGQGLQIAFSALDSGRLGIAAVAVGLAQAALEDAVTYAMSEPPSAARSLTTKDWHSFSRTWPRPSTPRAPPTSTPPAAATQVCPTHDRRRWPSWSPPTRR